METNFERFRSLSHPSREKISSRVRSSCGGLRKEERGWKSYLIGELRNGRGGGNLVNTKFRGGEV